MSDQSLKMINSALEPVMPALGELMSYKPILEELKDKYLPITVKDVTDVATMAEAKVALKEVKEINKKVEECRVKLKADALKTSQSIDGTARIIRTELEAIIDHLDKQAKFAEIAEAKANEQRRQERSAILSKYPIDGEVVNTLNIGLYSETEWTTYLAGIKARYQEQEAAKIAEAKKALELEKKRKQELAKLKEQAEIERIKRQEAEAKLAYVTSPNRFTVSQSVDPTLNILEYKTNPGDLELRVDPPTPLSVLTQLRDNLIDIKSLWVMVGYVSRLEPILESIEQLCDEAKQEQADAKERAK